MTPSINEQPSLAPIVLFAYKRPDELAQTIRHLQANYLAKDSDLYIFVDGPKRLDDEPKVKATQHIADQASGFRCIYRQYASQNRGLANSIIQGVSSVIAKHGSAIVLEDDLLTKS